MKTSEKTVLPLPTALLAEVQVAAEEEDRPTGGSYPAGESHPRR